MLKKLSILLFSAIVTLTLVACANDAEVSAGYYLAVDINPSIEFIVDGEDVVESFIFLNEDAAVLCADLDFVGMDINDAVELFVQTATEAGYVDPESDDNAVLITVIGEEEQEEQVEEVKTRVRERLNRHFARSYINAQIITEDFTHEDLIAQAEALGVSPGKLKLSLAAQVGDETLVLEELLEMPVKEIMSIIKEAQQEAFQEFKEGKMEEFRIRKQEQVEAHKARLDEYIANHPELTEEEIDALVEQAQKRIQKENEQKWQERKENWNQHREEHQNQNESEETEETDPSDQV